MNDVVGDEIRRLAALGEDRASVPSNVVVVRLYRHCEQPVAHAATVWDVSCREPSIWHDGEPTLAAYREGSDWFVLGSFQDDGTFPVHPTDVAAADQWVRAEVQRQLDETFPGRAPRVPAAPAPLPSIREIVTALSPSRSPAEVEGWMTATRLNRVGAPGGALWWLSIPDDAVSCLQLPDAAIRDGLVLRDPRRESQDWPGLSAWTIDTSRDLFDDMLVDFADDQVRRRWFAELYLYNCWADAEELVRLTAGWMRMEAAAERRPEPLLADVLERAVNEGLSDAEDPRRKRSDDVAEWHAAADAVDEALLAEVRAMDRIRFGRQSPSGEMLKELEAVAVELVRRVRALSELIGLVLMSRR